MAALTMTDMTVPSASDAPPVAPTSGEEGNRRGDIIRAAGRLFRKKGYNGTTIRDIADAVGMRSGSPFYHFKSKHEILFTVTTEGIEVMLRNLEMGNSGMGSNSMGARNSVQISPELPVMA